MKKESVNKFDLEAAFKALEEIEIPVVKGIKPNRENLQEKFTKKSTTEVLVEDYFDVNDQGDLEAAQEEREAEIAKAKLARIEKIVDLDAESEEDLLPSYVGKFIIQCPQCMTLFYKNQEDIEKSEENPEVVNINEICQHCGNTSGYTLIGKVDNVGEEEAENYDVEDFDENELNLDFEDVEEPSEEESVEDNVEDVTAEEENEEELELEPVEEVEETSEEEEEVKESLTLNEEIEDEIEEVEETPAEEILTSVEEVKEVAEEAAEAVLEASEEETLEDIKEVTDEVVENHFEVSEEDSDEKSEEDDKENLTENWTEKFKDFKNPIIINLQEEGNLGLIVIEKGTEKLAIEVDKEATRRFELFRDATNLDKVDEIAEKEGLELWDGAGWEYFEQVADEKDLTYFTLFFNGQYNKFKYGQTMSIEELKAELSDEDKADYPELFTESLTEAVDKELDAKLKAHNEYIEYLKDMIEKEEKSLANAKNDFVKKSIRSRIDALKADLEEALPEALKTEVEPDLPTAEEIDLEATQNTEEKEETKESLTESLTEEVKIISDLSDYTPWSGAVDTWNQIKDANKINELDAMLEEIYPDGLTMTKLNDILWFDSEEVLFSLGIIEEVEEALTETTATKPRVRHQSRREIFSRELAAHPAFEGISTRDLERYIIDLYLEDDPTADLDVEQVIEYVEDLGWGKIILDNIDNLSESQVRHFAQKDPIFVSTVKEFLGDWLLPNKNYSVSALVSELLVFLGKKPADREEAKDFKFDPNDTSYKEFKDELANAYYEAKRLVPVGEALVGDVNINLDARGQSVGLLKGQGGEVHNDMTENKENLDEFIGPAVASIAGASVINNVVDNVFSEDVEDATKVRKGSKVEYLAMELAKQDFFKGISVQIIQRVLIPSYIEEFGRDSLTAEEVTKYFSDYGFGGFVLDNYFDLSLKHIKTLGKQDPKFIETLKKYCKKYNMTPDEADYEKGKFNEFEELFDLSIGTVFEAEGELETIEELQEIYKELTPVTESLQESGDLDTLLDSEEFKKPISDNEVKNILSKYESLDEDVEPGIESELAIQEIVDTWEAVEEIDEETLDKLTENYLTEVYSNVKSFKTTDCSLTENKLVVEGKITFNSGKTKNTKFIYEVAKTADNKVVLEGLNADFATEKAFILNCNLNTANRLVVESLNYRYTINNTLVEGLTK